MSINLKGYYLNQRQLDAIVPVMNLLMQGKVTQKGFEEACVKALEAAGCPVGYDTTMPGTDKTVEQRAKKWIIDGRVGSSSKAIYRHMLVGGESKGASHSYPHDPDDLNRCLLLLELIPEWKPRMLEMACYGTAWAGLGCRWEELSETFLNEAGIDWCKAKSAPKTYALMKQLIGEEHGVIRFGNVSFGTC